MALFVLQAPSCTRTSDAGLAVITIVVDGHKVKAEVARTPQEQSRGLMYRRSLGTNAGMIFVYDEPKKLSFWMKNTFVPLSIAFLDADGVIVDIQDMHPQSEVSHPSKAPALYALEVNQGWFAERGIEVGAKAEFELPQP
ncbi:MAG: DUF192 domain-containing protein [Proteobacteria bacterium]|nr:DUF192 domain-containing protein [Pseudomonadota bacterium]